MAGTWTYDPALIGGVDATALMMQVRTLIADTNIDDQQLWDQQIGFALAQEANNIYLAAADCCRQIAAKYSRDVDIVQGELRRLHSARQRAYATRADELEQKGRSRSRGAGYAGGISRIDRDMRSQDADRVVPQYMVGLTDNWLPVGPIDSQQQLRNRDGAF